MVSIGFTVWKKTTMKLENTDTYIDIENWMVLTLLNAFIRLNMVFFHLLQFYTINNKYTITSNDPLYQHSMGQRIGVSFMDVAVVNRMYGCLHSENAPGEKTGLFIRTTVKE